MHTKGRNYLDKERGRKGRNNISDHLDRADEANGVIVTRIHETLQIDGETHPPRRNIGREVKRLHDRGKSRRSRTKPPKPI